MREFARGEKITLPVGMSYRYANALEIAACIATQVREQARDGRIARGERLVQAIRAEEPEEREFIRGFTVGTFHPLSSDGVLQWCCILEVGEDYIKWEVIEDEEAIAELNRWSGRADDPSHE